MRLKVTAVILAVPVLQGLQAAEITDIDFPADPVGLYEKFEIRFQMAATYANPYDSSEVAVQAVFHAPSGKILTVPGFWFQDFRRSLVDGAEKLVMQGTPEWRIRFAAQETGTHHFYLECNDRSGHARSEDFSMSVKPSSNPGFIRVHPSDARHMAFDNGRFYMPMGENVGWAGWAGTYDYDIWMGNMAEAGENWMRVWCTHFYNGQLLEWDESHQTGWYHGVGRYSQQGAWKWDYLVDLAEKTGIYIQMVTQHHGQFSQSTNPNWDENPYNTANGGFLDSGDEFFSDETARLLYKRKMRYTVARWGYSTALLAWELWNEVQFTDDYDRNYPVVAAWHGEMSGYLHAIDPWKHLVTTSARDGDSLIWSLASLDMTQNHYYGTGIVEAVQSRHVDMLDYDKPNIVGEFGADWQGPGADPLGMAVHMGIWAAAITGGGAMPWWWDNHIEPYNLYFHWKVLSDFWKDEDLGSGNFHALPAVCSGGPTTTGNARSYLTREEASTQTTFTMLPGGAFPGIENLSRYFRGSDGGGADREAVFRMNLEAPITFWVHIGAVPDVNPGTMEVYLDGATDPVYAGVARKGRFVKISIPAGEHAVRIYNSGSGWFMVDYIDLAGLVISAAQAFALSDGETAYVWIRDREGKDIAAERRALNGVSLIISGMQKKTYEAEKWDTWTGSRERTGPYQAGDSLLIGPFDMEGDAAFKIRPAGSDSLEPRERETGLRIFPNPCRDWIAIYFDDSEAEGGVLDLFDSRGRKALSAVLERSDSGACFTTLNTGALATGVYIFRIKAGLKNTAGKILCIQ